MYLHSQNHGGLLMDKSVIINGFIHQLFTKNEIVNVLKTSYPYTDSQARKEPSKEYLMPLFLNFAPANPNEI